ncbi:MAG: DUF1566 domain-containing protein [Gammaproteobacteria bacterium]|nr:DUF1566 domain-containing protein [Gammaproteobacteria bacterium]
MFKQSVYLTIGVFLGLSLSLGINSPLLANTRVNTFIDNGNGSVTDTATGLTWQQQDDNVTRTHADAITYCQGLSLAGNSNWRLPNIKELITIVDFRVDSPSIDDAIFPNTNSSIYWSASSRANSSGSAWFVDFTFGVVSGFNGTSSFFVRCVR